MKLYYDSILTNQLIPECQGDSLTNQGEGPTQSEMPAFMQPAQGRYAIMTPSGYVFKETFACYYDVCNEIERRLKNSPISRYYVVYIDTYCTAEETKLVTHFRAPTV